jgi:hypothetical protein
VVPRNVLHTLLVRSARVSKAKWHCYVTKHVERCDERGRELIRLFHLYLVVTGVCIKETYEFTPHSGIYNLIDSWQRKRNFWTCFI